MSDITSTAVQFCIQNNALFVSRLPPQHAGVCKSTNHKQPVQLGPCTTDIRDQPLQAQQLLQDDRTDFVLVDFVY